MRPSDLEASQETCVRALTQILGPRRDGEPIRVSQMPFATSHHDDARAGAEQSNRRPIARSKT